MVPKQDRQAGCSAVGRLLERYVDGELSPPQATEVEGHVAACPDCASALELARKIHLELGRLPQFDTPEPVIHKVLTEIDAIPTIRVHSSRRVPMAALAAAALVALTTAAILLTPRPQGPQGPQEQYAAEPAEAAEEARLAFALIADATRRAGGELRSGVIQDRLLATAMRSLSRSLRFTTGINRPTPSRPNPQPSPTQGGMT